MSSEEKVERYRNTDFKCPICESKLDYIPQQPFRRLEYVCSNEDCQTEVFFDEFLDEWFRRTVEPIPEPEAWKPKE